MENSSTAVAERLRRTTEYDRLKRHTGRAPKRIEHLHKKELAKQSQLKRMEKDTKEQTTAQANFLFSPSSKLYF